MLKPNEYSELTAEAEHELSERIFRATWGFEVKDKLPAWYEENRVQLHTRLGFPGDGVFQTPAFTTAERTFKEWGAGAYTRHVKSRDGDPWWPAALPAGEDGKPLLSADRLIGSDRIPGDSNMVRQMIDRAHREGLRFIAYNYIRTDKRMGELHPDWVCKRPDGDVFTVKRGDHLDTTGPFREVILSRLLELAEMGADAVYFDETHLPDIGCWGTDLEKAFERETGLKAPEAANLDDPAYRLFLQFKDQRIIETFQYWQESVHARYPQAAFLVSVTYAPNMADMKMSTNFIRIVDAPKSEYHLPLFRTYRDIFTAYPELAKPDDDIKRGMGFALLRDSADGRPSHIWLSGAPNEAHLQGAMGVLFTYGHIANIDVSEATLNGETTPANKPTADTVRAATAFGKKVSPVLNGARALRWAAVHYSEMARNRRGADLGKAFREVLGPEIGAFGALVRAGLPAGVVNDYQLAKGELDGCKLLFVHSRSELSEEQRQSVLRFEQGGGLVIENESGWLWHEPGCSAAAAHAFLAAAAERISAAPVRVTSDSARTHAAAYRNGKQTVVSVTNDFGWVVIGGERNNPDPTPEPPAPVRDAVVTIRSRSMPVRVSEVISGEALVPIPEEGGYQVKLPEFRTMSLLVIEPSEEG